MELAYAILYIGKLYTDVADGVLYHTLALKWSAENYLYTLYSLGYYLILWMATGKIPFHTGTRAGIFPSLSTNEANQCESYALASNHYFAD